jgi:glycine/D-amino acid oxidase-like deaminating enzyme
VAGDGRVGGEHFEMVGIPYRWSTQDGMPTDRLPHIGRYTPISSHLYVTCGFHKWGMTGATIAAEVLRDRITGRDNRFAGAFDHNRGSGARLRGWPRPRSGWLGTWSAIA